MSFLPIALLASTQRSSIVTVPDSATAYLTSADARPKVVRIAREGRNIGIAFEVNDSSGQTVYFSKSSDLGATFSAPTRVVSAKPYANWPHHVNIAMGGGKAYVSYRIGTKLYLTEGTGLTLSKPQEIADDVYVAGLEDADYDHRNQWLAYCNGLLVAYPSTDKNIKVGRYDGGTKSGGIKDSIIRPAGSVFQPKSSLLRTTSLLQDGLDVGTVRLLVNGNTVRVVGDKKVARYGVWVVGFAISTDGARSWHSIPDDSEVRDNHVTYLSYQEGGANTRFRTIATEGAPGEYEFTVGKTGREWVAVYGDGETWGTRKWQIVTSLDPTKGMFSGFSVVPDQWYQSVEIRPLPTPAPGERNVTVQTCKPSIIDSRGIPEVFWNEGSLLADSHGTAWQTSFMPADLVNHYTGVKAVPWKTWQVPAWSREDAYRRTTSYWTGTFNDIRTWVRGADVVHVAIKNHPTRAGATQTLLKADVTKGWSPLNPDEDSGQMDWMDVVTDGSNAAMVWISNNRICIRRIP